MPANSGALRDHAASTPGSLPGMMLGFEVLPHRRGKILQRAAQVKNRAALRSAHRRYPSSSALAPVDWTHGAGGRLSFEVARPEPIGVRASVTHRIPAGDEHRPGRL